MNYLIENYAINFFSFLKNYIIYIIINILKFKANYIINIKNI